MYDNKETMMKTLTVFYLLIAFAILLTTTSMAKNLDGTWKGSQVGGDSGEWTFVFADSQLTVFGPNSGEYYKMNVKFFEDDKYKKVKAEFVDASDPSVTGLSSTAIYKLEDGILTIAASEPGYSSAPKSFDAKWGVYVFKLSKEKTK